MVVIAEKFHYPTKFDTEPYGTIWKVIHNDNGGFELFVQMSDSDSPDWVQLGDLLHEAYKNQIQNPTWLNITMELYKTSKASC